MHARGVERFSITDHDALSAFGELGALPAGTRAVTGIEINSTYKENEVHVLGYGIDLESPELRALVERNRAARRVRMQRMVERLQARGYPLELSDVLAEAVDGASLGRPHVAKALVRAGIVADVEAAFRRFLSKGGLAYVPSLHVTPFEAIDTVAKAGGVPVLAHPGRLADESIVDELSERGLVGLEVYHPSHDSAKIASYRAKARFFGLVVTAGSDFHDARYGPGVVGMEVPAGEIGGFWELVS